MYFLINRVFLEHPRSVGETYTEHLRVAWSFAWRMFTGSCACFVHGLVPGLFVKTGSRCVQDLHARMVTHRTRQPGARAHAGAARSSANGYYDYVI